MVGCTRFNRGRWTPEEDKLLLAFVNDHGAFSWSAAHLLFPDLHRSGKSCRLRYLNQLHPAITRSSITPSEMRTILQAHSMFGNQWSRIAGMLRGRTDNHVKNVVNMMLKKEARRRAARVNFARRAACMLNEQMYTTSHSGMECSSETYSYMSLPAPACGVSVLPPPQVAMAGTHCGSKCSASSPGKYTALVTGGGACMMEHSSGVGMMSTNMETCSNMLVSECKRVASSETISFDITAPTSSYNEWAMQAVLATQEPHEKLSSAEGLPSVQRPFQSLQLHSVQNPFESFQLQKPLQSLEGSELPSVQISFQSLSLGSELPSVQEQCKQVDMACRLNNLSRGNNDLLEAIKLAGCYPSSSNSTASSPSSATSIPYFDDSYLKSLLMGIEANSQSSTMSSMTSSPAPSSTSPLHDLPYTSSSQFDVSGSKHLPEDETTDCMFDDVSSALQKFLGKEENLGAVVEGLMVDGMERDLVSMVLGSNNMWISMPGACHVGESVSSDPIPDFY